MAESIDQLKQSFVEETMELIMELEAILLSVDVNSVDSTVIDRIFRIVHTVKGSGGMLGFEMIMKLTHKLEDHYDKVRSGKQHFSEDLLKITLRSIDVLKELVLRCEEISPNTKKDYDVLLKQLIEYGGSTDTTTGSSSQQANQVVAEKSEMTTYVVEFTPGNDALELLIHPLFLIEELQTMGETYIVARKGRMLWFNQVDESIDKDSEWIVVLATDEPQRVIDEVFEFVSSGSLLSVKKICDGNLLSNDAAIMEINSLQNKLFDSTASKLTLLAERHKPAKPEGEESNSDKFIQLSEDFRNNKEHIIKSIRVDSDKIDQLMNLVSEMVTLHARLQLISETLKNEELIAVAEKYDSFSKQLRDNAFDISLVPFSVTSTRFKRLVHDLSLQLGKDIEYTTVGEDTVLDRKIIEQLNDPIMHILRNAIDHGIESAEERAEAGKSKTGHVEMKIAHQSNSVIIRISDDGKGMDVNKLREVGIRKGLIPENAKLSYNEAINLVFLPGFSSATKISNVSGRGVGLDVVKKNLQKIRGEIHIDTEVGKGSTFVIKLPLTLSIIDGLLVRISERRFIIPLIQVDKIFTYTDQLVDSDLNQMLLLEGNQVPYFDLRSDFEIEGELPERREIVLVSYEKEQVALIVDSVEGENQTVLKPLGKHYKNQDFISGGTILGDGSVALVLDVNRIVTVFTKK